ncbi:MAG: LemA family protein [Patescibacteria group bacterium]
MNYLITIGAIVVLFLLWLWMAYNGLIRLKNQTDEAWSDIDVQLKRRYDLIPNLVETVKGYAAHERTAFENVTKARAAAMGAATPEAKGQAENMLSGALKTIFALAEAYPDLKANQNFAKLQDELSDTENKIQAARRFYNGNVRDLNTRVESFPTNMFAKQLGFSQREFFEVGNEAEKAPVKVQF